MAAPSRAQRKEGQSVLCFLASPQKSSSFFIRRPFFPTTTSPLSPPLLAACYYAALFPWQLEDSGVNLVLSCSRAGGHQQSRVFVCTRDHTNGVTKRLNDFPYLALFPSKIVPMEYSFTFRSHNLSSNKAFFYFM